MPPFDAQKHSIAQSLNWFTDEKIAGAASILAKSIPCSVDSVDSTGTIVKVKVEIQQPDLTFPLISCPVYGPQYLRWPLQKGDKGVMLSADYSIGKMSGLGTGVADLTPPFSLSAGVFFPIGNKKFGDTADGKKTVIYGPEGVILKGCPGDMAPKKDDSSNGNGTPPIGSPGLRFVETPAPDSGSDQCGALLVDKDGITSYGTGDEAGNYTVVDKDGFKVYIAGALTFIVDAGGMRWVGGNPISGGGNYGIKVTPTGTHIDDVNFLPHVHKGVTTGSGASGPVDDVLSPAAREDEP